MNPESPELQHEGMKCLVCKEHASLYRVHLSYIDASYARYDCAKGHISEVGIDITKKVELEPSPTGPILMFTAMDPPLGDPNP